MQVNSGVAVLGFRKMKDLIRQIAAKDELRVIVHTASAHGKSQLGMVDLAATKYITIIRN